jgi:hypothetical protein
MARVVKELFSLILMYELFFKNRKFPAITLYTTVRFDITLFLDIFLHTFSW